MNTKLYVLLVILILFFSACSIDKVGRAVGVESEIDEADEAEEEVEEEPEEEEVEEEEPEPVEEEEEVEEEVEEVVEAEVEEEVVEVELAAVDEVVDVVDELELVQEEGPEVVDSIPESAEEEEENIVEGTPVDEGSEMTAEEKMIAAAERNAARAKRKDAASLAMFTPGEKKAPSEQPVVEKEIVAATEVIKEGEGEVSEIDVDSLFADIEEVEELGGGEVIEESHDTDSGQQGLHVHIETMRESYQLGKEGDFDNVQRQIQVMITDPPPEKSFGARLAGFFKGLVGFAVRGSVEGSEDETPYEDRSQIVNFFMKPITVFPFMRLKDLSSGETIDIFLDGKEAIEVASAHVSDRGSFQPGVIKLDEFWMNKGGFNPSEEGLYEVYVDVRNAEGQIMLNPSGVPLLSSSVFSVDACEAATCSEVRAECGVAEDSCGGKILCGRCGEGEACSENRCIAEDSRELCEPKVCSDVMCGVTKDGCGGNIVCGKCRSGFACNEGNRCLDLAQECEGDGGCEPGMFCDIDNGFCVVSAVCDSDDQCGIGEVCDLDRFTCVDDPGEAEPSFVPPRVVEEEPVEVGTTCPNAEFTNYCCSLSNRQMGIFRTLFKEGFIPVDDITFIQYELNFQEGQPLC